MTKLIRKIFYFILSGTFVMFMAACYGVPAGYKLTYADIDIVNQTNQPINGLETAVPGSDVP